MFKLWWCVWKPKVISYFHFPRGFLTRLLLLSSKAHMQHINSKRKLKHEKAILCVPSVCKTVFCIKSCTKCLAPLLKLLASSLCLHNTIELFLTWRSNPVPSGVKIQVIKSSRIHLHITGNLICLQCKTRKNHPFNIIMLGFQSIKCQRQFCTYTMHHEHQRVKSALTKGVGWQNISFFRAKKNWLW